MNKLYKYSVELPDKLKLPTKSADVKITEQVFDVTSYGKEWIKTSNSFRIDTNMLNKFDKYMPKHDSYYGKPSFELYKHQLLKYAEAEILERGEQLRHYNALWYTLLGLALSKE